MHIPAAPTAELSILTFTQALARSGFSGGYDADKWLYVPDFYTEYRYILGTRGTHPLICIGVNPSTAAPDNLDNTLKSVQRVTGSNGFDSFIMFNVYAQRATRPEDMDRVRNEALHRENMEAFEYILEQSGANPAVWAAWGNIIEMRPYSEGLCNGHDRHRRAVRRPVVHSRHTLQKRAPSSPAVPEKELPA